MEQNHSIDEVQFIQEKQRQEIEKCITEIRNGKAEAFDDLYHSTEQFVYYCIIKNGVPEGAVHDVMQEVYTGIFQNLNTLRDVHAALGWIKKIAFHKSMDYFRHNKNALPIREEEQLGSDSDLTENMELPEDIVDNKESQRILWNLIEELPEDYRKILVAYYFDECKVEEIAEALGIPAGTVKTKLFRARKQLEKSIQQLEKQQGIRLHSVAVGTLLLLLFHMEAQTVAVPAEISETVYAGLKTILKQLPEAAGMTMGNGLAGNASGIVGKTASTVGHLTGGAVKKCIIALIALLLGGTCIVFVIKSKNNTTPPADTGQESTDDTEASTDDTEESTDTTEEPQTEAVQPVDPERQAQMLQYYHEMYEEICRTHQWPEGTDMGISQSIEGGFMEALQYTVIDFDGDGYEEFAVSVINADNMISHVEKLYKYNPDTKECSCILSIYPGAEYCDNGVAFGPENNSRRFGNDLFYYDAASNTYVRQVWVFRWDRASWEEYNGNPFPEAADLDGDNSVWCFIDPEGNYDYMDQAEYDTWYQEAMNPERRLEPTWFIFSAGWQY